MSLRKIIDTLPFLRHVHKWTCTSLPQLSEQIFCEKTNRNFFYHIFPETEGKPKSTVNLIFCFHLNHYSAAATTRPDSPSLEINRKSNKQSPSLELNLARYIHIITTIIMINNEQLIQFYKLSMTFWIPVRTLYAHSLQSVTIARSRNCN